MKRDIEVIVDLCLQLEELEAGAYDWHPQMDGESDSRIQEHLELAKDAGLMQFELLRDLGGAWTLVKPRLTNLGHDFLDAMRTPRLRAQVAAWAKKIGRAVTVDLAIAYVRAVLTE